MTKKILGIIPARGGSKGVTRKNIRSVGGKPLIYWSIIAAKESKFLTLTYVTTDDSEIAEIAKSYGAALISRPQELGDDKTPMIPVLKHLCLEAENLHGIFDYVLLLQPTAPFRTGELIDRAIALLISQSTSKSLISLYQVDDCHPSRMYRQVNGELQKVYQEPSGSLRQDLEPIYHRNGAIYACTRDLLITDNKLICDSPTPFIMEKSSSINIDDEQDLIIADFLMCERNKF